MKDSVKVSLFDGIGNPPKRVAYPCEFAGQHFAVLPLIGWTGQSKKFWQVTHRGSGWKCGGEYPTKALALEYVRRLELRAKRLGIDFATRSGRKISSHPKFEALKTYTKNLRAQLLARA